MSLMAYTASAAAARALVARSSLRPVASQIGAAKMDVASTQGIYRAKGSLYNQREIEVFLIQTKHLILLFAFLQ